MEPRNQIAKEAARLLYLRYENEYKQAKDRAANNLSLTSMPSNYEVAIELDKIADEVEGWGRREMLIEMRKTALKIMKTIEEFEPKLIGSVWRGTARQGSDIDITLYSSNLEKIKERLLNFFSLMNIKKIKFLQDGQIKNAHHIKMKAGEFVAEVVVRDPKDRHTERCEIYGDEKRGLRVEELDKLLKTDPLRRLIPRRRSS